MYFISQLHGKGAEHLIQKISMMPRLWLLLLLFGAALSGRQKKPFCIRGQKTRVFVTVFGVLGTFFHHFCRGRDEKSSFHPVPYKSGEKSSFHPLVVVYIFFQPRQFRFFF